MYADKTIAVVIPAYNEESQIDKVISTLPDFVDRIVVVNDGSTDATSDIVWALLPKYGGEACLASRQPKSIETAYNRAELVYERLRADQNAMFPPHTVFNDNETDRLVLIEKPNGGKGTAIAIGYKWCRDHLIDCTAIMDGDGQMDPGELENIIMPIVIDGVDYVKGNRLIHRAATAVIPKTRLFGNSVLSLLTKIASGYWRISDTQTGYTAISLAALESMPLHTIYKSYGCPNDILIKLNMACCTVKEVPIKPVYNVGERSKMKIRKVIPTVSWLLLKGFFKRLIFKYVVRDFHPLSLMYFASFLMASLNIPFFIMILLNVIILGSTVTTGIYMAFILLVLFSFQSLCFGMWMDMQDNDKLQK